MSSTDTSYKPDAVTAARSSEQDVAVESGGPVDMGSMATMEETRSVGTILVIIASLLFVGVFGGSLIGGIVTGDPNNVYFIIIVVFAILAIGIAGTLAVQSMNNGASDLTLQNKPTDLRNTFTSRSDEEQNEDMQYGRGYPDHYMPQRTPAIREISAGSVAGDMSALSPHSYADGFSTKYGRDDPSDCNKRTPKREKSSNRSRRGPFDFASIASSRSRRKMRSKEDPPEENAPQSIRHYHSQSRDPAAPKVSSNGDFIEEDDGPSSHTRASTFSRQVAIDYDSAKTPTAHGDRTAREGDIHSLMRIHSTKNASATPREPSIHNHNDPDGYEVEVEDDVVTPKSEMTSGPPPPPPPPPPPRTTPRTPKFRPPRSDAPKSPGAASDVGSTVSSIFFKPFNAVFGKKKATSEANFSEASSYMKGSEAGFSGYNNTSKQETSMSKRRENREQREERNQGDVQPEDRTEREEAQEEPTTESQNGSNTDMGSAVEAPSGQGKPPRFNRQGSSSEENRNLGTIDGSLPVAKRRGSGRDEDRYQSAADNQSSAGGSVAPSELKSTAGSSVFSGAASSTFDPQAHSRALNRVKANSFHLGAEPIVEEAAKYEDEESSVGELNNTGIYDVFAPPGPIGLVVDSTKAGPIVHSLKKTSPMIGLINSGDVIIALDDKDVRKMNAASLTRLMAKKAKQPERKFTLMPVQDY